ncbi:hypothetical protein [Microbulbifer hainanensis]|uniref:hypothetical protein n=1 Tax=Microbulbifer hainanensis TaxID=2735675 RepID=UPI0018660A4E|nr:hypothetical protein [Microbulbifer hainanensis]
MQPLDKFKGAKLKRFDLGKESSGFEFDCGTLAAFNPTEVTGEQDALIGSKVLAVTFARDESLKIELSNNLTIKISLEPDCWEGPEAFCATFKDGTIVVE